MLPRAGRVLELPGWRAIVRQARPNLAPRPSREETAAVNYCRCSWSMADIQVNLWECITLPLRIAYPVNVCPVQVGGYQASRGVTGRIMAHPETILTDGTAQLLDPAGRV